jgi:hypothetical protein
LTRRTSDCRITRHSKGHGLGDDSDHDTIATCRLNEAEKTRDPVAKYKVKVAIERQCAMSPAVASEDDTGSRLVNDRESSRHKRE